MELHELDYALPDAAIAQTPAEPRDAARLLRIQRTRGALSDHVFGDLPALLEAGDCVVVNDSRVMPARVFAADDAGRSIELLFVEPIDATRWRALVRPGRRCRPGVELRAGGHAGARLTIVGVEGDGLRVVERTDGSIDALLAAQGLPPLPPYIARYAKPGPEDADRYQTVYAKAPGSVAAPTAGLHFSDALIARLRAGGVAVQAVTLHVGPGTFRPIKSARVEDHAVAAERVSIPGATAAAVEAARRDGRRVIAVGTTVTRALESVGAHTGVVQPFDGRAALTIHPGHRFRVVRALITNFHLPRSSLLSLVCAFAGRELVMRAYAHALASGYRFYSYGDACLIE